MLLDAFDPIYITHSVGKSSLRPDASVMLEPVVPRDRELDFAF